MIYIAIKALQTIKQVKIINKKKLVIAILKAINKIFIVYRAILKKVIIILINFYY